MEVKERDLGFGFVSLGSSFEVPWRKVVTLVSRLASATMRWVLRVFIFATLAASLSMVSGALIELGRLWARVMVRLC